MGGMPRSWAVSAGLCTWGGGGWGVGGGVRDLVVELCGGGGIVRGAAEGKQGGWRVAAGGRPAAEALLALQAPPVAGDLALDHGPGQGQQLFRGGDVELVP